MPAARYPTLVIRPPCNRRASEDADAWLRMAHVGNGRRSSKDRRVLRPPVWPATCLGICHATFLSTQDSAFLERSAAQPRATNRATTSRTPTRASRPNASRCRSCRGRAAAAAVQASSCTRTKAARASWVPSTSTSSTAAPWTTHRFVTRWAMAVATRCAIETRTALDPCRSHCRRRIVVGWRICIGLIAPCACAAIRGRDIAILKSVWT